MLKGYGLGDGRVDVESRGEGELCKVTTLCVKEMYVGAALAIWVLIECRGKSALNARAMMSTDRHTLTAKGAVTQRGRLH